MKIRITAEYDVKKSERGFDVMDSDGFCLCSGEELEAAMNSLAGMVENEMLDPASFEVQIVDVIPAVNPRGELPPPYTPPKYRGDA